MEHQHRCRLKKKKRKKDGLTELRACFEDLTPRTGSKVEIISQRLKIYFATILKIKFGYEQQFIFYNLSCQEMKLHDFSLTSTC